MPPVADGEEIAPEWSDDQEWPDQTPKNLRRIGELVWEAVHLRNEVLGVLTRNPGDFPDSVDPGALETLSFGEIGSRLLAAADDERYSDSWHIEEEFLRGAGNAMDCAAKYLDLVTTAEMTRVGRRQRLRARDDDSTVMSNAWLEAAKTDVEEWTQVVYDSSANLK